MLLEDVVIGLILKDCEQYNIEDNKWKPLPSLNEARYDNGSIYINKTKTIYCFGGYNGSHVLNTMEKLELTGPPESYAWKLLTINPNEADTGTWSNSLSSII